MAQYHFDLPNMTCGGCERGVKAAIAELDPAALVTTDLAARKVVVESNQPEAAIHAVLEEAGFTA